MNTRTHIDEPPRELIRGTLNDAKEIASAEVDKLKAEAHEVADSAKVAAVGIAAVSVAGILFAEALAWVLYAIGLPRWASFGIIAIVMGGIGGAIVFAMKNRAVGAVKSVPVGIQTRPERELEQRQERQLEPAHSH